ncbi:MAG: division/cell wall cluster transcriptional repressor MraZ [Proteobacteria bacterium]|nr:division/cell wall cluster transcriptional repressor MraZ [Pseudomonadota bacterium]NIS72021.1 division/cell wall cluster transcriptional repressor MraZ [Pseudomonadota bacterium]
MFRGRYEHIIDAKGRIKLPSRYWEVLQNKYDQNLIITNFDGCLCAFPLKEWDLLEKRILALPAMKREVRYFKRFFLGGAVDCWVDKQRRVLIPQALRGYAKLKRDIALVGVINRFEIWARERLDPQMEVVHKKFEEIVEPLGDLVF